MNMIFLLLLPTAEGTKPQREAGGGGGGGNEKRGKNSMSSHAWPRVEGKFRMYMCVCMCARGRGGGWEGCRPFVVPTCWRIQSRTKYANEWG